MRRLMILVTLAVTALAGVAALVGPAQAGGGCHNPASSASTAAIELRELCFGPTVARVETGREVAFINKDPVAHNIVGLGAQWGDFEEIMQGEVRRFTFAEPGIYPYACYLHPGMVGAVVVGGDDERGAGSAGPQEPNAGDAGAVGYASSSDAGATDSGDDTSVNQSSTNPVRASDDSPWTAMAAVLLVAILLVGIALAIRSTIAPERFALTRSRRSVVR